jgi:hypothetical protein
MEYTEIKDFQQLKGIINKATNVKLLIYYYCESKDTDLINQLIRSIRKYGKRTTQFIICNLTIYPGMNQSTQSICMYSDGRKLFQLNGNPNKKIIDECLIRYV